MIMLIAWPSKPESIRKVRATPMEFLIRNPPLKNKKKIIKSMRKGEIGSSSRYP